MRKVYYNGNVITMENEETAEYVLINGDRIESVGKGDIPKADEYTDLNGKTIMPAFIDPHSHMTSVAMSFLKAQLDDAESVEGVLDRIKKFIEENKKENSWISAMGYDNNSLAEKRHITAEELDSISGSNAVVIQHKSGHSGIFNTEAAKRLNIRTKDGLLEESEYINILKNIPMENGEALMNAYDKAQNLYFSYGITTAQEGYALGQLLPIYRKLVESGILKIDLNLYPDIDSYDKWQHAFPLSIENYNENIKIAGLKIMLDGSPQGGTAWVSEPYTGGGSGFSAMTDNDVDKDLKWAKERNVQVIAHCNGDMACGQFIDAVGRSGNRNAVMIHAQLLRRDQLKKVKEYGIIPSFFIAHVFYWGDVHIKNFGIKRASAISPAKSALDEKIMFTFHQDAPVVEPDMFKTIWCAVKRQTKSGIILGEEERIDVLNALKAVTVNAAVQYSEQGEKGSLKEGKLADMIIIDRNPFETDIDGLKDIKISETIKGGVTVYKA